MRKKRTNTPHKVDPNNQIGHTFESPHDFRPFGYYVCGGLDITGEHTAMDAQVTYDSEEDIKAGCAVDSFTDPTVGFFDVAESMGVEAANAYMEQKTE